MTKTIYDLIAEEIEGLVSVQYSLPTFQRIRTWLAAIEDIKPDWKRAPTWAQWWAVDIGGNAYWHENKPTLYSRVWFQEGRSVLARFVALPEGCDWRVMCYSRPLEV
jgi:hypothetical protein